MSAPRLASLALILIVGFSGCMGNGKQNPSDVGSPLAPAAEPSASVQEVPRPQPTSATSTSAQPAASNSPAQPSASPSLSPTPVSSSPAPPAGTRDVHFRYPDARGAIAIELVVRISGTYRCEAHTSFGVRNETGPTSRHVLWFEGPEGRERVEDHLFKGDRVAYAYSESGVDTRGAYDGTSPIAHSRQDTVNNSQSITFEAPDDAGPGPDEWVYLVAARDVRADLGEPVAIDIECTRPFTLSGVRGGTQVWLEDEETLESDSAAGAGGSSAIADGRLDAYATGSIVEWSVVALHSNVNMTLRAPDGLRSWQAWPLAEYGLDYWDLEGGPGEYYITVDSDAGSFALLLAALWPVDSIDRLPDALRPA